MVNIRKTIKVATMICALCLGNVAKKIEGEYV